MKLFGITKTGYSHGLYGCSNEYFTCIYTDSKGMHSFRFHGLYGAEERIARLMVDKGYKQHYIASEYGKIPSREGTKYSLNEFYVEKNFDEVLQNR